MKNLRTYVMKNDDDIKMLLHPYRQKIFFVFQDYQEALTAKQMADELKEPPSKVNYHMKKLEEFGALEIIKTESINGIIAKYYRPTFDAIRFQRGAISKQAYIAQLPAIEQAFNRVTEKFREDLDKHVDLATNNDGDIQRRVLAYGNHLYMTAEEQDKFVDALLKLIDPYLKEDDSKEVFSIMQAMARIK